MGLTTRRRLPLFPSVGCHSLPFHLQHHCSSQCDRALCSTVSLVLTQLRGGNTRAQGESENSYSCIHPKLRRLFRNGALAPSALSHSLIALCLTALFLSSLAPSAHSVHTLSVHTLSLSQCTVSVHSLSVALALIALSPNAVNYTSHNAPKSAAWGEGDPEWLGTGKGHVSEKPAASCHGLSGRM